MFISFEGIEGAGKTTVIQAVAQRLKTRGIQVLVTREPGGSDLGQTLRKLLLNCSTELDPMAELCLFLADRAQHVSGVIRPALERGDVVLCDRYIDSTIAYQGYARGLDLKELQALTSIAAHGLQPDLTLLLDLPVELGLERMAARRVQLNTSDEGRFDLEKLTFHKAVYNGFKAIAAREPERVHTINAALSKEDVLSLCLAEIDRILPVSCQQH